VATFSKKGEAFYREKFMFAEDRIGIYRKICDDYNEVQQEIKHAQAMPPLELNKPSKELA
jgi:hypothetical protein